MGNEISFKNIQSVIQKRIVALTVIVVLSALLAIIFSGENFLKPRYKSSAAVYPINVEPYSDESETEQMMQLFDNEDIRSEMIEKFSIANRYGYEPDEKNYKFKVNKLYNERVSISPTRYESVEIICQDENPEVARDMVNEVIRLYDYHTQKIEQDFHQEYFKMLSDEVEEQQKWVDSLNVMMTEIKNRTGIIDYELQTERITEGYMKLLEKNVKGERLAEVKQMMDGLRKEGANLKSMSLLSDYITENMQTTLLDKSIEQSKATRKLSYANVIKKPEVTDKKHWPVRWLILLLAVVSSFLAAVVFFLLIEK